MMLHIKAINRENGLEQEVVIIGFQSFFGEGYCLCMNENGVIFHIKNEYITITDKQYLESCAKESIDIELADFMNNADKRLDRVQSQQLTNIICELDECRKKLKCLTEEIERQKDAKFQAVLDKYKLRKINTELKKQIDELKEKLWKSKQDMMTYHVETVCQSVKDTAKKCYEKMLEDCPIICDEEHTYSEFVKSYKRWLKECFDVEVE